MEENFTAGNIQSFSAYDLMNDALRKQKNFLYKGEYHKFIYIEGDYLILIDLKDNEKRVPLRESALVLGLSKEDAQTPVLSPVIPSWENKEEKPDGH